jgi:hypothetical protein
MLEGIVQESKVRMMDGTQLKTEFNKILEEVSLVEKGV